MNHERLFRAAGAAYKPAILAVMLVLAIGIHAGAQSEYISGLGNLRLCMWESEFTRAFPHATGPDVHKGLPHHLPRLVYSLPPVAWPPGTGLVTSEFEAWFVEGRLAYINLAYTERDYPGRLRNIYSVIWQYLRTQYPPYPQGQFSWADDTYRVTSSSTISTSIRDRSQNFILLALEFYYSSDCERRVYFPHLR